MPLWRRRRGMPAAPAAPEDPGDDEWILDGGTWDDAGVWQDDDVWQD